VTDQVQEAVRGALYECRTDLMIAADNAADAARSDPRWEGVAEKLRARGRQADVALEAAMTVRAAPAASQATCAARQYSDQMVCAPCDLEWDVNDRHAPACRCATDEAQETRNVVPQGGHEKPPKSE